MLLVVVVVSSRARGAGAAQVQRARKTRPHWAPASCAARERTYSFTSCFCSVYDRSGCEQQTKAGNRNARAVGEICERPPGCFAASHCPTLDVACFTRSKLIAFASGGPLQGVRRLTLGVSKRVCMFLPREYRRRRTSLSDCCSFSRPCQHDEEKTRLGKKVKRWINTGQTLRLWEGNKRRNSVTPSRSDGRRHNTNTLGRRKQQQQRPQLFPHLSFHIITPTSSSSSSFNGGRGAGWRRRPPTRAG